jgi:hypothetical protein
MRKFVVFRISNIDVPRKNGFWLISQRLLSGFAQNFAQVLQLYRCPLQACFPCQKWPLDPSRKGTFRAEIHKVPGQRAFVAGASPGVRQLEKQKSPFPNLRLLFRKGATFCMWPTACPPLHNKRLLQSDTNFTFQALPGSVLKLETSCQKEKCCQGPSDTSWLFGFWPSVHARAWRRAARFDCFFHNLLNIWNFSFFFGPRYIRRSKRRE